MDPSKRTNTGTGTNDCHPRAGHIYHSTPSLFPPSLSPTNIHGRSSHQPPLIGLGIIADGNTPVTNHRWISPSALRRTSVSPKPLIMSPNDDKAYDDYPSQKRLPGRRRDHRSRIPTWFWSSLAILITTATCWAILHFIRRSPLLTRPPIRSAFQPGQAITRLAAPEFLSPTPLASQPPLAVLLFLPASSQPPPPSLLDHILASLRDLPPHSLTLICPPSGACPTPNGSPTPLASLSTFRPPPSTDAVLVLDGPLPSLDPAWLPLAVPLTRRSMRIAAFSAIVFPPLACPTRPGPASLPVAPFLLPTAHWPSPESLADISGPLAFALSLATNPAWRTVVPTLLEPLSTALCEQAIAQLASLEGALQQLAAIPARTPSLGILLAPQDMANLDWQELVCRMVETFEGVVYMADAELPGETGMRIESCAVDIELIGWRKHQLTPDPERFIRFLAAWPKLQVLVYLQGTANDHLANTLSRAAEGTREMVLIGLPADQIEGADWILGLPIEALKNWHKPKIDISVITKDRSQSLDRLLRSLNAANYYGDRVNLGINMEQTSDRRTREIVSRFEWAAGTKTVRQRIIHGGLLPAVIEAWYPSSMHDSYGVFLEDDTEVSGQFYGWLKFALLSYRYAGAADARIYGISLYQPQHNELRPEGRRPFNASALHASLGLPPTTRAYASQVPCSWGALFFPEAWVGFQRFLTFRLADRLGGVRLEEAVVASAIRSNKWPKSWKKYMIEWVYLRGLEMVYPNYHDPRTGRATSLSTNHLEPGTHVHRPLQPLFRVAKDDPASLGEVAQRAATEKKLAKVKKEFEVDLMGPRASLLDGLGPAQRLPSPAELVVVDLWGEASSLEEIQERGWIGARLVGLCGGVADWSQTGGVEGEELMEMMCGG